MSPNFRFHPHDFRWLAHGLFSGFLFPAVSRSIPQNSCNGLSPSPFSQQHPSPSHSHSNSFIRENLIRSRRHHWCLCNLRTWGWCMEYIWLAYISMARTRCEIWSAKCPPLSCNRNETLYASIGFQTEIFSARGKVFIGFHTPRLGVLRTNTPLFCTHVVCAIIKSFRSKVFSLLTFLCFWILGRGVGFG